MDVILFLFFLFYLPNNLYSQSGSFKATATDSTALESQCQYVIPVFFSPRSFCDPDVESQSILDCRDDLIKAYSKQVKTAERKGSSQINDVKLMDKIYSLKSIFINPHVDYFGLFTTDNGQKQWQPVELKPQLKFIAEEYCDGPVVMMKLSFQQSDSTNNPILYAGIPKTTPEKKRLEPRGFFSPHQLSQKINEITETAIPDNYYEMNYDIVTTFDAPAEEPRILNLVRYDSRGYVQTENDTLIIRSELVAVTKSGETINLHQDNMFGHHALEDAYISDPFFVDINGDGLYDIVFESSADSQILGLQLPYGGIEIRYLRKRDMSGSGGC